MHKVIGYENGRAIWSENVPANPGSMPIRGQLVVGGSGAYDKARQAEYQRKHAEKVRAEKADAA